MSRDDGASGSDHSDGDTLGPLPMHTVVRITGNQRTRKSLLHQTAVVKHVVGLGGWHWLALDHSGELLRIQRNALEVVQYPTGNEVSTAADEEIASLLQGSHPRDAAARASERATSSRAAPPRAAPRPNPRRAAPRQPGPPGRANLHNLSMPSLQRYVRTFNVPGAGPHPTRDQLMSLVVPHFQAMPVDEDTVLQKFIAAIQRRSAAPGQGRP